MKKAENIGALLKERRDANALNQTELGKRLSVSQATISQWEQGNAAPKKDQLVKLNEILGGLTSTSEFITEAESQTAVAAWLSRSLAKKDLTVGETCSEGRC